MGAEEYLPARLTLTNLRSAARSCQGCALYRDATQTVFGEGPNHARVVVVGEQPGDKEDTQGAPFVGPAGRLFDHLLAEAGIDRAQVYVTNAVKHFKFKRAERGKHRLHQKPNRTEVVACRPWLLAEINTVRPRMVVCLGATAAQALLGPSFRITKERGNLLDLPTSGLDVSPGVLATAHPSSVLRAPDDERKRARAELLADLKIVATHS